MVPLIEFVAHLLSPIMGTIMSSLVSLPSVEVDHAHGVRPAQKRDCAQGHPQGCEQHEKGTRRCFIRSRMERNRPRIL